MAIASCSKSQRRHEDLTRREKYGLGNLLVASRADSARKRVGAVAVKTKLVLRRRVKLLAVVSDQQYSGAPKNDHTGAFLVWI